jgi:hypothetical protein
MHGGLVMVYNEATVGKPEVTAEKMFPDAADTLNVFRHWRVFQKALLPKIADPRDPRPAAWFSKIAWPGFGQLVACRQVRPRELARWEEGGQGEQR